MNNPIYKTFIIAGTLLFFFIVPLWTFGQEIKEYYPTEVCLIQANGIEIDDSWEVGYGFDHLNDIVYFNMRPNADEEFTIFHKIYNIADSFDNKKRLIMSEYYLDDMATLTIRPVYDNPEDPLNPTGYHVKLKEILPYSIRKNDIKSIEFSFFIYF